MALANKFSLFFLLFIYLKLASLIALAHNIDLQSHCRWRTFSLPLARKTFDVYEASDADIFFDDAIKHLTNSIEITEPYGVVSWSSSRIISTLLDEDPGMVKNLRVCDLGCGTGIASLVAASLDASEVIALDHNHWALSIANISFEKLNCKLKRNVIRLERFDMKDSSTMLPSCDILLMSDLLYFPDLALLCAARVVEALMAGANVLVTDPGRTTAPIFLQELKRLLRLRPGPLTFTKDKSKTIFSNIEAIEFQAIANLNADEHGDNIRHQYLWLSTRGS